MMLSSQDKLSKSYGVLAVVVDVGVVGLDGAIMGSLRLEGGERARFVNLVAGVMLRMVRARHGHKGV